MSFTVEGDYIWYDGRKIARLLPSLSLADLRAAEEALNAEFGLHTEHETKEITENATLDLLSRLKSAAEKIGGLLSYPEIEEVAEMEVEE